MPSYLNGVSDWPALARAAYYRPKELAALCHVSLRQLERYFSEKAGCSPQKWLNDLRLQEAPRLLLEGHHVKELAFELGYTHPSHFIREFRRVYHCTPLEFVFSQRSQGNDRRFLLTSPSPGPGVDPFGTRNKAGSFLPKTGSGNTRHLKKRFHLFSIECERQGALSGAHRGRLTSARSAMVRSQTSPSCN